MKFVVSLFTAAFGDICAHGSAALSHLTRKAVQLLPRESRRNLVNVQRQKVNLLPNFNLLKSFIKHLARGVMLSADCRSLL
jgi:hypothetical protein